MANKNPEKRRAYARAYYAAHKEKDHARSKRYQVENKEKVQEYRKRYYLENKATVDARSLAWRLEHPARMAAHSRKHRTKFTPADFTKALCLQRGLCGICATPLADLSSAERHADHDHLTDEPRGVLCRRCNTGLGHFRDSPALLAAAIIYINNPPLQKD